MKTKIKSDQKSIYAYVLSQLDRKGVFRGTSLPDDDSRPYSYGNDDAELFTPELGPELQQAVQDIVNLLHGWLAIPSDGHKKALYDKIKVMPMIRLFHPLAEELRREKLSFNLLHLAEEWIYTARDREVIKFAYLLCGLIGLKQIKDLYSALFYKDLFTLARCEEFTIYLGLACHLSDLAPQKELWYLARRTCGWGRAITVSLLDYRTDAQQLWLLKNGLDLKIYWPALAPVVILESHLSQRLKQEDLPEDIYEAALHAIVHYLLFLSPVTVYPTYEFTSIGLLPSTIRLSDLLGDLLARARTRADSPQKLLGIFAIKDRLEHMAADEAWDLIDPNACNLIISQCDQLIYSRDWLPLIKEQLFLKNGRLNETIVDFAADLNIDIWSWVFKYWQRHPTDKTALNYVLYDSGAASSQSHNRRLPQLLTLLEKQLGKFIDDEQALVQIMNFLQNTPGEGAGLLIAALTSIYDYPRGMAALALSNWDRDKLTPPLKVAIVKALHLNENPFIEIVLSSLLDEQALSPFN